MNLTLHNVIQTNSNGDEFTKIPEIYIRGMHIKYLRIPDDIMSYAKEQSMINMENRNRYQKEELEVVMEMIINIKIEDMVIDNIKVIKVKVVVIGVNK